MRMGDTRNISIMSWNVGSDGDFARIEGVTNKHVKIDETVVKIAKEKLEIKSPDEQQTHLDHVRSYRLDRIQSVFNAYAPAVPIFCLQECDAETLNKLPENYEHIQGDQSQDTAVAWDKTRFKLIETKNVAKDKERTLVILEELETGLKVGVCSAHLTGCDPDQPDEFDAQEGNDQLDAIEKELNGLTSDLNIVGMDANTTPNYERRTEILKTRGFAIDQFKKETNYNYRKAEAKENPLQKVDYIAAKGKSQWFDKIHAEVLDPESEFFHDFPERLMNLGDIETNPSDHRPIVQKVNIKRRFF